MPRYFIDLHDGKELLPDKTGMEFTDLTAARAQAIRIMQRIGRELRDVDDRQDYVIAVRSADGVVRLRLRLSIEVEPLG